MAARGPKPTCECGECVKCRRRVYSKRWRDKTPETQKGYRQRRAEYMRQYRVDNRERIKDRDLGRWRADINGERIKHNARLRVKRAVQAGRLVRGPCEKCGATPTQGHHDDYSKPLDVRWLCTICHAAEHAPEAQAVTQ